MQANAGATPLKPITLMFNSVAWQNRPARIYISGEDVDPDNRCLADLNTFPRYLVLSAQDQGRSEKGASSPSKRKVLIAPDGKEITMFNYDDSTRTSPLNFPALHTSVALVSCLVRRSDHFPFWVSIVFSLHTTR
jgi:hypothetical protein